MKKPLPAWSIAAALVLVLGGVGAVMMNAGGQSIDKDALIKSRGKPGGASAPSAASYGHARGTPITPEGSAETNDPRRRPTG